MKEMIAVGRKDRILITNVPDSFAQFVAVDKLTPTAIRMGAWPEAIYAGRVSIYGEVIRFEDLPTTRA